MNKKELIEIVRELDCDKSYASCYRYAHSYITSLNTDSATSGLSDSEKINRLFSCISQIKSTVGRNYTIKRALGISGDNARKNAETWCQTMTESKEKFEELCISEIDYVLSMCARKCEIKKKTNISLYLTDIHK